jgi:hypothetical protein
MDEVSHEVKSTTCNICVISAELSCQALNYQIFVKVQETPRLFSFFLRFLAEVIQAGGKTLHSDIHKLADSD